MFDVITYEICLTDQSISFNMMTKTFFLYYNAHFTFLTH